MQINHNGALNATRNKQHATGNMSPSRNAGASARSRRYWLVKFAPFRTSWAEIVRRGTFTLRGVRSPLARKHLSEMRLGDAVLLYHSQQELAVVGLMEVTREGYPDPTSADPQWLTCDFAPVKTLEHPVVLDAIKADPLLAQLALVRQPRLAVMPVAEDQFQIIVERASA
jgi:predicted RNA-binding protein with PUA-like domain